MIIVIGCILTMVAYTYVVIGPDNKFTDILDGKEKWIVIASIIVSILFFPGYEEPQFIGESEIVSVKSDVGYLDTVVYEYVYEVENDTEFSGTKYDTDIITEFETDTIISEECKTPTLYTYVKKAKGGIWFLNNDKDYYILYLPADYKI